MAPSYFWPAPHISMHPMLNIAVKAARRAGGIISRASENLDVLIPFVSIDPQRDSSAQLLQYSRQFGHDFIGVGGSPSAIDAFAGQFKVKYAIGRSAGAAYFIDHTSSVALITPRAQLRALFSLPLRPEAVATDVQRIVQVDAAQDSHTIPGTGVRQ